MIIVYSSKPMLSKNVAQHFANQYPQQKIVYIHSMYFSNVSFAYPQNIKWKEFPYIQETDFKISDIVDWKPAIWKGKELVSSEISLDDILNCKKIIYAAEPDSTDTYLFSQFIKQVLKKDVHELEVDSIVMNSLAISNIDKAFENMSDFSSNFKNIVTQGKIKKYFDYNFNFNSLALFGKIYKEQSKLFTNNDDLISSSGSVLISKNMIQLLYFLKSEESKGINYKNNYLILKMNNWTGTGKYAFKARIGNAASSLAIIENLINLKLIEYKGDNLYMTERGISFLKFLPKDCMDLDLPFRIQLWMNLPFEESKVKMDDYLNNYFKKVKNKLKAVSSF